MAPTSRRFADAGWAVDALKKWPLRENRIALDGQRKGLRKVKKREDLGYQHLTMSKRRRR
jgi:hypothetical protein